jgi:hypothetical protein
MTQLFKALICVVLFVHIIDGSFAQNPAHRKLVYYADSTGNQACQIRKDRDL